MYQIDFNKPAFVHFIGIGGISMSGLAEILLQRGFTVSGSDAKESDLTRHLAEQGATLYYGQRSSNIDAGPDVVVYTAAIHPDNPELKAAKDKKIPCMTRAELLGELMKNYETPIAISGTHGKTTTTSMLSSILLQMDTDPTLSIGGILQTIGGNIRIGQSELFVTEACEYTNSFLSFFPKISAILNIDADHLDFFKDLADIRRSFRLFSELLPEDGTLVINGEIPDYSEITENLKCRVLTYGYDPSFDVYATDITYDETARPSYMFHMKTDSGETSFSVTLGVTGEHNVSNSLAAIAIAMLLGGQTEDIQKGALAFSGTDRRFQYKGMLGKTTVIDDYAHHPTEITATLQTAKKYPHKTTWCVFQPHTYTRTKALLPEFAEALSLADEVVLADIYAARETDNLGISSKTLQAEIEKLGGSCHYFSSFDAIENFLLEKCEPNDLLITMGAGDVFKIGENLLGI
nr:UDP-N-acetylmuramate--L-alanine ligase [Lachnospiraceae bacterium]